MTDNQHPTDQTPPVSGRAAGWLGATFYVSVAIVAFLGQVSAATHWLHWPLLSTCLAVGVLELGGIALSARADYRRRLNEKAYAARTLSAAVALFAVAFNWIGHAYTGDHLSGAFFAGMSALGYCVWLINSGDRRRDQLRAAGMLPPPPPSYDAWHWIRHPSLTWEARTLAKAHPDLGTYRSLEAARNARKAAQQEAERAKRIAAVRAVLVQKLGKQVDPAIAEMAQHAYDLDAIAAGLTAHADHDLMTTLVSEDLTPDRLLSAGPVRTPRRQSAPKVVDGAVRETPALSASTDSHVQRTGQASAGQADSLDAGDRPDSTDNVVPLSAGPVRRTTAVARTVRPAPDNGPTVEALADTLSARFGSGYVGKPAAVAYLREVYGTCSADRAIAAKNIHNARRESTGSDTSAVSDDAEERSA